MIGDLSFGKANERWKHYDVFKVPILHNDQDTRFCGIVHEGKLKSVVTNEYVLLPNEEAQRMADQAAKVIGLDPFKVIYNYKKTRMHAIYMPKGGTKIDGDDVKVGVDVRNGIDGLSSFGCGVFTFRGICSNGVIYGYKQIYGITEVHIGNFEAMVKDLANRMILIMERTDDVLKVYRKMTETKLTEKLIAKLKKSGLPKKVLPNYVTDEEVGFLDLTQWNAYNDITEQIWHREVDLPTKVNHYEMLHRVMPLLRRR